jgi:magnesium transporter
MRELLTGVVANYHSNVAKETNEIVKTLTIYAAILLPLSLIAGVYGMNMPIWPNPDNPLTFWGVIVTMLVIAAGSGLYFRSKKWL